MSRACTLRMMDRSTPADGDGRIAASPMARSPTWVIEQNQRIAAKAVTANQRKGNARNEEAERHYTSGDLGKGSGRLTRHLRPYRGGVGGTDAQGRSVPA
jgi:hypothetical protein